MSDDLKKNGPADAARVNVNETHEVRYWCKKWSCTEEMLRAAVQAVGVMASDVDKYFWVDNDDD